MSIQPQNRYVTPSQFEPERVDIDVNVLLVSGNEDEANITEEEDGVGVSAWRCQPR